MPRGSAPRAPQGPAASDAERALLAQGVALHLPDIPAEVPGGSASALLPVLHHIQDALGFGKQSFQRLGQILEHVSGRIFNADSCCLGRIQVSNGKRGA